MRAKVHMFFGADDDRRSLALPVMISLLCHLAFFALVIYSPAHLPGRKISLKFVNVSLINLSQIQGTPGLKGTDSGKAGARPPAKKAPLPKAAPPAKPATPKAKPAETVPAASEKWSEKTSLKEETFKPERVVKQAIKKIEEQAEESRPSTVAEAIDRIRGKISEKETDSRPPGTGQTTGSAEAGSGQAGGRAGGLAGPGGGGGVLAPEILIYQQEIAYHIRSNWAYSEQLAGQRKDLEARLIISISANGEIKDVQFEKKSGNSFLDDSAYKAVLKSNPLPALPRGYKFYTVILGFTPAGLQ